MILFLLVAALVAIVLQRIVSTHQIVAIENELAVANRRIRRLYIDLASEREKAPVELLRSALHQLEGAAMDQAEASPIEDE